MSSTKYIDGSLGFVGEEISVVPTVERPMNYGVIPDPYCEVRKRRYRVQPQDFTQYLSRTTTYTNYLTYSADLSNAAWTKENATVTASQYRNPWNGLNTANYLTENSSNAEHRAYQTVSVSALPYCFSAIVSGPDGDVMTDRQAVLRFVDSAAAEWRGFFDLASGRVMSGSTAGATIVKLPRPQSSHQQQWWIALAPFTPASGTAYAVIQLANSSGAIVYAGSTRKLVVSNMQLELDVTTPSPPCITTSVSRSIGVPFTDWEINTNSKDRDPFAFLVNETPLEIIDSSCAEFTREFARVPGPQVRTDVKFIQRPALHGVKSGTAYGVCFDEAQKYSHIFTSRIQVNTSALDPEVTVTNSLPSGNITITDTSANVATFAANATLGTIQTAIAVLAAATGLSAAISGGSIIIQATNLPFASYTLPTGVKLAGSSALVSGGPYDYLRFAAEGSTTIRASYSFSCNSSHGATIGDRVALWAGDTLVTTTVVLGIQSSTQFTVAESSITVDISGVTHCAFSSDAAQAVINGPKQCSVKITQDYYLPAYSEGITTAEDINPPDSQLDPVSWLAAIIAGSDYTVESVSGLGQWKGRILMQEKTEIQMSDAIQNITP